MTWSRVARRAASQTARRAAGCCSASRRSTSGSRAAARAPADGNSSPSGRLGSPRGARDAEATAQQREDEGPRRLPARQPLRLLLPASTAASAGAPRRRSTRRAGCSARSTPMPIAASSSTSRARRSGTTPASGSCTITAAPARLPRVDVNELPHAAQHAADTALRQRAPTAPRGTPARATSRHACAGSSSSATRAPAGSSRTVGVLRALLGAARARAPAARPRRSDRASWREVPRLPAGCIRTIGGPSPGSAPPQAAHWTLKRSLDVTTELACPR